MNCFKTFIFLTLFSVTFQAKNYYSQEKPDSVTSLANVPESYKLHGKNLTALAEKILYKNTLQEDMYLYVLRPLGKLKL